MVISWALLIYAQLTWNTAEHGIDSLGSNPPINKHSCIICIITEQIQTNASYMHQSRSPGLLRRHRWLRWGTFDRCQSNTYTKQEIVTRLVALVRSCIIVRTPAMRIASPFLTWAHNNLLMLPDWEICIYYFWYYVSIINNHYAA